MEKNNGLFELLNTIIISNVDSIVKISEYTISKIRTCLQNAQENIEFLQLESQLKQE